jgi:hypothetical protein
MSIDGRLVVRGAASLLAAGALTVACSQMHQVQVQDAARQKYAQGDYEGAVKVLEQAKEGKAFEPRDRVAYWMNLGMLDHYAKKYSDSNQVLEKAAKAADALYTTSISTQAETLLTNETMSDYQGENFERVLLHVVGALNYVEAGDLDNARVEAVKTNEKLKYFRTQAGDQPLVFSQDAFADWLTGVIYEMQGEPNEALISYKSAAAAYRDVYAKNFQMQAPAFLGEDIVRTAKAVGGFDEDIEKAKAQFPNANGETAALMKDHGEVLLLHACGEAPAKKDFILSCLINAKAGGLACDYTAGATGFEKVRSFTANGEVHKIAMPIFERRRHRIAHVRMSDESQSAEGVLVEPVAEIAIKDLADRMHRTYAKALARAATKVVAEGATKKLGGPGQLLSAALSIVNNVNEEADKRSWSTLPSEFNVARLWVTPGEHDLALDFSDGAGRLVRHATVHVKVAAGKRVIVTFPTVE